MTRTPAQIAASLAAIGLASLPVEERGEPINIFESFGTKPKVEKGHRGKTDRKKRKNKKIANASKRRNRK